VTVSPAGYEVSRDDRKDANPGGYPWKEGSEYYGLERVEKIAEAKKDPTSLWLALDNGFKVKVDQWGKEVKRKERKKKEGAKKEESGKEESGKEESKNNGVLSISDFRSLTTIEEMRKNLIPALAQWCRDVNGGKKISPKTAYTQLNGVTFEAGKGMGAEDFPVLYECLIEGLEEHAKEKAS
ncbi:unnamed protein product, partial [marine sediment metagenome]